MASQEIMGKNYIIWNDFNTRQNNILIEELPVPSKAEEKKELITVNGRNGFLTINYDCYNSITYEVQLNLHEREQIDIVKKIFKGSGTLFLSCCPDVYYKATITSSVDFERVMYQRRTCIIVFELQPLAYVLNNEKITCYSQTVITNYYNSKCYPCIRVYGNGSGNLFINNETVTFSEIDEFVELDCELEECYKNNLNCNPKMFGEFPILIEGDNIISFDGSITHVEILPYWRKL